MAQMFPSHESAVTRGLSQKLWNLVPLDEIFLGPNNLDTGFGIFEDFLSLATDTTDTQLHLRSGGAEYFIDSGATVLQLGGNESSSAMPGFGGVLRLYMTSADNDECGFQLCGAGGEPFFISDTPANARDLIFEIRFRTDTISNSELSFFAGLIESGAAAVDTFLSTGDPPVLNELAHIGLYREEDDGDDAEWVYGANTQTVVSKQADFITSTVSSALVADTWYRFGFRYYAGTGVVTPFFNGTPYTTDNITVANIAAATFPDGEGMSPAVMCRAATTGGVSLDIDWIACAVVEAIG